MRMRTTNIIERKIRQRPLNTVVVCYLQISNGEGEDENGFQTNDIATEADNTIDRSCTHGCP